MKITVLKGKLHRVTVTESVLNYEGSVGIDEELYEAAGMRPFEKVMLANLTNGNRWETYVIPAPRGSRQIQVNGAGAHLASEGDQLIIFAFAQIEESETLKPKIVIFGPGNEIIEKR